ncbi:GIY-YIG nuclease family protein [Candidatus Saccharibacteria bacterium]|nr:GIY-YIG nuclease family protein [Candidatus Saccharibacteria bacterium]
MYYVYVLQSKKDGQLYTGYTNDLKRRFEEHNTGKSFHTNKHRPYDIIYYEASINKEDAMARERYLKSGMGKRYIKNRLKLYLLNYEEDL